VKHDQFITVIVVNYNGLHLLKSCLEFISSQSLKSIEIILVDNASTDNSVPYVRDNFPAVKIVSLASNMGFAGANVEGLKHAKGDYVMLVNNDAELDRDCIANLCHAMETDRTIGIGATKMIVYGKDIIDSAGDGFSTNLKGFKRGEGEKEEKYNREEYIFGACAGAALYRRDMLEEIGFFDEDFFLIQEDTDLNFRAQLAGWKVMYVPSAIVFHKVRSTIGKMSDRAIYYSLRNSEFVRFKNVPLVIFLRCLPSYAIGVIIEFLYFVVKYRKFSLYVKAKWDAIKLFPKMVRKRSIIMKNKKVDNKQIYHIMTPFWQKEFFTTKSRKFFTE